MRKKGRSMKTCHICKKKFGEETTNALSVEKVEFCSKRCALDFCARIFKWHTQYWAAALKALST